jgi:hypothetical protein
MRLSPFDTKLLCRVTGVVVRRHFQSFALVLSCALASVSAAKADESPVASGVSADGKVRADMLSLKRTALEDAQRVLQRGVEMLPHGLDSGVSVMCGESLGYGPVLHDRQFAPAWLRNREIAASVHLGL